MKQALFAGMLAVGVAFSAAAEETSPPTRWDGSREGLTFRLSARTPAQMAAFYEGRGVTPGAIAEIRKACFLGGVVVNRTQDVVWLDLGLWRFFDRDGKTIQRHARDFWNQTWARLDVPLANRSVFGWTQLPERRDLRPAESVGGNVSLVQPPGSFTLEARFPRGAKRDKGEFVVRVDDLRCPREGP